MKGEYLTANRVFRIDENGLVTYHGRETGENAGQPIGMKVGFVEKQGGRFRISCLINGMPPSSRRFDSPVDTIIAAFDWFTTWQDSVARAEANQPIMKEPTPYEDLLNERAMSTDALEAKEERERRKDSRIPAPGPRLPSFDDMWANVRKSKPRVSITPPTPPVVVPAPPAPPKPARLPSSTTYLPKGTTVVEEPWFMKYVPLKEKKKPARRFCQRQKPETLEMDPEESLEALQAQYARELGEDSPATPHEAREEIGPVPGPAAREDSLSWLPAVLPRAFAVVHSVLRCIGQSYPAPAQQPFLLAAPRRVYAHPAIIEHVGEAARYQGLPLAELEMNTAPARRRSSPPVPKWYLLPSWEFPWLESEELRQRFAAALADWSGSKLAWVSEQLDRREVHRDLVHIVRPVLKMGRAWGAIPTTWPPQPSPDRVVYTAPEPLPPTPELEPVSAPHLEIADLEIRTTTPELTPRQRRVARAQELTELHTKRRLEWTDEEDDFLRTAYGTTTIEDIAKRLERTVNGVMIRAKKLGLTRKKVLAKKEIYPATAYARVLNVDMKCVQWWGELGLRVEDSVIAAGTSHCKVIAMKDMVAFLNQRPELFEPKRVDVKRLEEMGGVLSDEAMTPPWRWKRVMCPAANRHAIELPLYFYAPLKELAPSCPCCGSKVGRHAVGSFSERYKQRARSIEHWQMVTAAGAKALRIIAKMGGRTDITKVADVYRGGIAEIEEMQSMRKLLTRMTTTQLPLLTLEARPVKGTKKGEARVFFELTEKGRAVIEALDRLQETV